MHILQQAIEPYIEAALRELGVDEIPNLSSMLDKAKEESLGDVAFPCFMFAKNLGKAPDEFAAELVDVLQAAVASEALLAEVHSVGGFLNFRADVSTLASHVLPSTLSSPERAGHARDPSALLIEHTSANPNGPFHVGRSRNAILGDCFVRLHRLAGDEVRAEYYVDDMGKQVGLLAWALEHLDEDKVSKILAEHDMDEPSNHPHKMDHQRVRFYQAANLENVTQGEGLGVEHHRDAGVTTQIGEQVAEMVRLSEEADADTLAAFGEAYQPVLDGMLETLERLGIQYDSFTKESRFIIDGSVDEVLTKLRDSELAAQAENGAWYLELAERGVAGKSTRFYFQRGDGSSLYATRDIAYHQWKWTQADRLLNVLGEDHRLQSHQVSVALEEVGSDAPEVVFYAFTKLPDGKMSTRRGNVVFMDDLLDEAATRATEVVSSIRTDLDDASLTSIGEAVGISSVRFNLLRVSPEKGINFRWEDALSLEADSAPFLMYSHARACSIARRLKDDGHDVETALATVGDLDWSGLTESAAALVRRISRFAEELNSSLDNRRPNQFSSYLLGLATDYNRFYRDNPVRTADGMDVNNLALSEAARHLICAGCKGFGVIPLESM